MIPAHVREVLRAPATLAAVREAFVAAPRADVVVVVGAGVEVPPSISATRPAGRARVAAVPLDVAVQEGDHQSADALVGEGEELQNFEQKKLDMFLKGVFLSYGIFLFF